MSEKKKISITRALTELKVTKERIASYFSEPRLFIAILQGANEHVVDHGVDKATIERRMQSDYDTYIGLINRQTALKEAIVASNASTTVTVNGRDMTVAAAIELRATIEPQMALLKAFKAQYTNASTKVAKGNAEIEANVRTNLEKLAEGEKVESEATKAITDAFKTLNETRLTLKLHDYLNLADKIKKLEDEINTIKTELDYILSESNTRTEIEVEL